MSGKRSPIPLLLAAAVGIASGIYIWQPYLDAKTPPTRVFPQPPPVLAPPSEAKATGTEPSSLATTDDNDASR
ncbi:hypothetical protein H4R35_003919 [Dimargaris xerosporica]|nr:hypothetical protein H4R35_003919 [Dimargaris xerosporica]